MVWWDCSIQTDHIVEAWRTDLVVVDKNRTCKTISFCSSENNRIKDKVKGKIEKYQDLVSEFQKIWYVIHQFI